MLLPGDIAAPGTIFGPVVEIVAGFGAGAEQDSDYLPLRVRHCLRPPPIGRGDNAWAQSPSQHGET